jgi:hypothetical protein
MLSKLAKIANRLDSIGLTKEADVLDAFIRKVAEDHEYGQNYRDVPTRIANEISSRNPAISEQEFKKKFVDSFIDITAPASSNPSENLIETIRRNAESWADKMWNSPSSSRAAPWSDASPATGWEKYIVAAGTVGNAVKEAWVRYTQSGAAGADPSFKSFTSWYNNQLKNVWGGGHKSPTEIIKLLNERATAQAMAGSHVDASSPSAIAQYDKDFEKDLADPWKSGSGSAQAARPSSVGGGVFEGVSLTPEERARATDELNRTKGYGRYGNK